MVEDKIRIGDRIVGIADFRGVVRGIDTDAGNAWVKWDDKSEGWTRLHSLRRDPDTFKVGDRVRVQIQGPPNFHEGSVIQVKGQFPKVKWDNGNVSWPGVRMLVKLTVEAPKKLIAREGEW